MGYFIFFILFFLIWAQKASEKSKVISSTILVVVFTGIRYNIGFDYPQYLDNIQHEWYSTEPLSAFLQMLAYNTDPILYFVITSLLMYPIMIKAFTKDSVNPMESILFFLCFQSFYICSLSTIRQAMAWAVIWWLISQEKKGVLKICISSIVAFCFHSSGLAGIILLFPLSKLKKVHLWLIFSISFVCSALFIKIISLLPADNVVILKMSGFLEADFGGATKIKYIIWVLYIVCLLNYNRLVAINKRYGYFIIVATIGIGLYNMTLFNAHMADRLMAMFWGPVICMIPAVRRITHVPKALYAIVCLSLFAYSISLAHQSSIERGDRPSVYYPYRTIFEFM